MYYDSEYRYVRKTRIKSKIIVERREQTNEQACNQVTSEMNRCKRTGKVKYGHPASAIYTL